MRRFCHTRYCRAPHRSRGQSNAASDMNRNAAGGSAIGGLAELIRLSPGRLARTSKCCSLLGRSSLSFVPGLLVSAGQRAQKRVKLVARESPLPAWRAIATE